MKGEDISLRKNVRLFIEGRSMGSCSEEEGKGEEVWERGGRGGLRRGE